MRILFDISHPAHVHFFKHMIWELEKRGHTTAIVAREKEVTHDLLDHYGFEYISVGHAGHRSRLRQLGELIHRDWVLFRVARRFQPKVILTRNPCGAQVARLVGAVGIFDTDDGRASGGIHVRAAVPFAHVVTTPDCMPDDFGAKHVKYPGYKQTAYLHPDHFTPNPDILDLLGVRAGERFFIVRFVAMASSHDRGEVGFDDATKAEVIRRLGERGRVFLSSEGALPDAYAPLRLSIPPHRIHDALAFATLCVGDSQTVAAEAAVLGTPSLRLSTYAGRVCYLEEMQERYGLVRTFRPSQRDRFFAHLDGLLAKDDPKAEAAPMHRRLLAEKCNVARWMCEGLDAWAGEPGDLVRCLAEQAAHMAGKAP